MKISYRTIAKFLSILLSLAVLIGLVSGCRNKESAVTETKGKSFIWEIKSDKTSVYLLGSVHVASRDIYPLASTIENAFESAQNLVVEVNINNISQFDASQLLMKYGTYPEGDGFKKNVTEELYEKLKVKFQEFGIDIALLDSYRPFVIYNIMSLYLLENSGYKSEYGIDFYFLDKAEKSGKNILELETAEYQMDLLSSVPDEIIIQSMQYDIENPEMEKELQELLTAWQEGDVAKMEALVFEPLIQEPELAPYYEILFDRRNLNMVQKIEAFLADDDTYFIVVGAGHLVGEKGLLNLLHKKGYDVEQLYDSD